MKIVNFVCPPDLDERLRRESERTGAPRSEVIRRALAQYLDKPKSTKRREASSNAVASSVD